MDFYMIFYIIVFAFFKLKSMDKPLSQEITYTYYKGSYPHKEQLSETDWQNFNLKQLFLHNDTERIIAEHNQKPIGSIVFFSSQTDFLDEQKVIVGHISYLEVMTHYRKQKIGSHLLALATCELIATNSCSWVTLNSLADSVQFYKKNNFNHVFLSSYLLKAKNAQEVRNIMGIESLPNLTYISLQNTY